MLRFAKRSSESKSLPRAKPRGPLFPPRTLVPSQIRKLLPTWRCPDDYSFALIVGKLSRQ
jgi:hypothetical protein